MRFGGSVWAVLIIVALVAMQFFESWTFLCYISNLSEIFSRSLKRAAF